MTNLLICSRSFADFSFHLHTNAVGPIITAQKLLKTHIPISMMVFMSSDSASATKFLAHEDGFAAYAASKAALNHALRVSDRSLSFKIVYFSLLYSFPSIPSHISHTSPCAASLLTSIFWTCCPSLFVFGDIPSPQLLDVHADVAYCLLSSPSPRSPSRGWAAFSTLLFRRHIIMYSSLAHFPIYAHTNEQSFHSTWQRS